MQSPVLSCGFSDYQDIEIFKLICSILQEEQTQSCKAHVGLRVDGVSNNAERAGHTVDSNGEWSVCGRGVRGVGEGGGELSLYELGAQSETHRG